MSKHASSQYQKQCSGKRGFSTPANAKMEISRSHANVKMEHYLCPWCRMWHVGHSRTKKGNAGGSRMRAIAVSAALALSLLFAACQVLGLAVNTSQSLPAGLYVNSGSGSLVVICPPGTWGPLSAARGYRDDGSWNVHRCTDGAKPLLKPIVAQAGDKVAVSVVGIAVNGKIIKNSAALTRDSKGRILRPWSYGEYRVRDGEVWLVSDFSSRSFDSRYFGPVKTAGILERVKPWIRF